MKFFVTGAHGFIGQNLCRYLSGFGNVYGVGHRSSLVSDRSNFGLNGFISGDLDEISLDRALDHFGKPDSIFHLAGGSTVGASIGDPRSDFFRTVSSTNSLLDWVRRKSISSKVIYASSSAVYGASYTKPIPVEAPLDPYSPYGVHKHMAEQSLRSYADSFGLDVAIVRFFSVYGPGLRKQLLWDICKKSSHDSSCIQLGGTGEESRDWIHVDDAVRLLYLVGTKDGHHCLVVNGGTGYATKIRDVARNLLDSLDLRNTGLAFNGISRPGDPPCLLADTESCRAVGFVPSIEIMDGLQEYAMWFKSNSVLP